MPHDNLSHSNFLSYYTIIGIVFIFFATEANAQKYLSSFGAVTNLKLSNHYTKLLRGDFNGDGNADFAAVGENEIRLFFQSSDGSSFTQTSFITPAHILTAAAGKLNHDGITDFVIITDRPLALQVYLGKSNGKYSLAWKRILIEPSENILLADITNDRKTDIILYGRRELGATIYTGNGNGTFQQNITLFSEYSFSALTLTQSNGDALNDVVAANWISNQILTFTAFGKLKFSSPTVINCNGTPQYLATGEIDRDNNNDIVVGYFDKPLCETFSGDGSGGYQRTQTLQINSGISDFALQDVNGDGSSDIIMLFNSRSMLLVKLNNGRGVFDEETPFYAGKAPICFTFFQYRKSSMYGIAILDSVTEIIRVMYPANAHPFVSDVQTFGVGLTPTDVLSTDLNKDGFEDIILANEGSQSISILLGAGGKTFQGQIALRSPSIPSNMQYYHIDDTLGVLVSTNNQSTDVSVWEINPCTYSYRVYTLPTQGKPDILSFEQEKSSTRFHILALERDRVTSITSIIKFEKISGNKFTQQVLPISSRSTICEDAAISLTSSHGDGYITYALFDPKHKTETIYHARYLSSCQINAPKVVYSFPATEHIPMMLWSDDLNDDHRADIIFNLGEPENKLYIMIARNDTTFSPPRLLNNAPVAITAKNHLWVRDCNLDGKVDIVFENELRKNVQVCYGNGSFSTPSLFATGKAIGGFTVSNIGRDSTCKVIITDSTNGTVTIMPLHD